MIKMTKICRMRGGIGVMYPPRLQLKVERAGTRRPRSDKNWITFQCLADLQAGAR